MSIDFPGRAPWSLDYSINNGEIVSLTDLTQTPYPFPLQELGNFKFEGFNDRHCNGIVSGNVEVSDISFGIDATLKSPSCQNATDGQIELTFEGGQSPFIIEWDSLEEQSNQLFNISPGDYKAQVVDQLGCYVEQSFSLPNASPTSKCRIDLSKSLYIPNAFSPNDDGINDGFTVYPASELIQSVKYNIFDRWGNLLYESAVYNRLEALDYWTGEEKQIGVYICLVEVLLVDGSKDYHSTDVTLIL